MTQRAFYCGSCNAVRVPDELMALVPVNRGPVLVACRPQLNSGLCFRRLTRPRSEQRIERMSDYLERNPRP